MRSRYAIAARRRIRRHRRHQAARRWRCVGLAVVALFASAALLYGGARIYGGARSGA